jgi:hypothetical protein
MYNLMKEMIYKDYQIDIDLNETYNQFFETNFMNTFHAIDTEDIKNLNNHLLTTQLEYFQNFILKQNRLTTPDRLEEGKVTGKGKVAVIDGGEVTGKDFIIHSLRRNINLQNSSRHNFRIRSPLTDTPLKIDKVILPIEDTSLCLNPMLIVSVNSTHVELHLRGTMSLRNRDYGVYAPFYEIPFTLSSDTCRIQYRNQLYKVRKGCDVYKITSVDGGTLQIEVVTEHVAKGHVAKEFICDDFIRVCNFDNREIEDDSCLQEQYKITNVTDDSLTVDMGPSIEEGLYVMNVSLQNTVHLSSLE